jgi:hypothetical protein
MMLDSRSRVELLLWIGQNAPLPAPYEVTNAFRTLEVTNRVDPPGDGFQMSFALGKNKQGEYSLLQSGLLNAETRVVIGLRIGAKLELLIDGVIDDHQISPGQQPGASTLTVSGKDVSEQLNLEEKDRPYGRQPDSMMVDQVLGPYVQKGIVHYLDITKTKEVSNDTEKTPWQLETDREFIQRLADRNGFVFYVEPVKMSFNKAYWGPENREGPRQAPLSYDLGPSTNVLELNIRNDSLAVIETNGSFLDPIAKTTARIPNLPSLRIPPLTSSTALARRIQRLRCTANRKSDEAATASIATISRASEPVLLIGKLDTVRYGSVLRPRCTVGVRGVGRSYDGDYFVRSVTHDIRPGVYVQSFELSRDGAGALFPIVRMA